MHPDEMPVQPLIDFAVSMIRDGKAHEERAVFQADAEARLCEALDSYLASPALVPAVHRLMSLAFDLETEDRSPRAAQVIAAVVERPEITHRLRVLTADSRVEGVESLVMKARTWAEAAKHEFERFKATEEIKSAPVEGAEAPRGSIKLNDLVPRRRFH